MARPLITNVELLSRFSLKAKNVKTFQNVIDMLFPFPGKEKKGQNEGLNKHIRKRSCFHEKKKIVNLTWLFFIRLILVITIFLT